MTKIRIAILMSLLFSATAIIAQTTFINIDKAGSPNPIFAGADITYTITVSTEGPDDAANAVLDDLLPPGTTFASLVAPPTWNCTTPAPNATGNVNCTNPLFSPGSDVFTLVLHTDPALTGILSNTATITTTTNDPDQNDNTSTVNTPVESHSNLGVTKSATPDPAPIGGPAMFAIDYSASGPSTATNATITDTLPAGTLFSSISASGWSCTTPAVGTNGVVSCTNTLAPGASGTVTINGSIDPSVTAGTLIANTASITSDAVDSDSTNDSASDDFTAQFVSGLDITKNAAPNPVPAGSTLTYTIDYGASGPSVAPNVVMNDILPPQTTFQSIVAPGGWSCTTPAVGVNGTVNCTIPSLASGATGTFTIVVNVDPALAAGTTISNTATIAGDVSEDTSDNSSTDVVTTSVAADAGVTKTAPATTFAGNTIAYSIDYTAFGPSQSTNVTISDTLPVSTTFVSINAPGFSCTTPAVGASGTVSCSIAALAPSATGTITINVTVVPSTPPSVITNTASVSSDVDTNAGNDSSDANTTVLAPLVTGTKTVSQQTARVGENITYTIVLHNGGAFTQPDDLSVDEFIDVLPVSLSLVSANATSGTAVADIPSNTVRWNGSILAGGDVTITIIATVLPNAAGSTISNQGAIHFDGDNNGTNESSTVTNAPGGGPTVFAVVGTGIPTLSPALLIAMAMMLVAAGWVTSRR
jgi:uncharacterized repeat protein (TIGR01451 family)